MVHMVTTKVSDRKANGIVDRNLRNIFQYVTLTLRPGFHIHAAMRHGLNKPDPMQLSIVGRLVCLYRNKTKIKAINNMQE